MSEKNKRDIKIKDIDKALAELDNWKPERALECPKCGTCFECEKDKEYASGVLCWVCRDEFKYRVVGVCHPVILNEDERPDYCNDLNAIHALEKKLFTGKPELWERYLDTHLKQICEYKDVPIECATAEQRGIAILLTMS